MAIDWTRWDSDPYWLSGSYWDVRPPWVRPQRPGTMPWKLRLKVAPTGDALDVELVKDHLRVSFDDDDELIGLYAAVAREYVEMRTGICLVPQTWQLVLDRWPRQDRVEMWPVAAPIGAILLPRHPVQSVTSVTWTDKDMAPHTISPSGNYVTDLNSRPARIVPVSGVNWPSTTLAPAGAIVVEFDAGFTDPKLRPRIALQAILQMVGHLYENREAVVLDRVSAVQVPMSVQSLVDMLAPVFVG